MNARTLHDPTARALRIVQRRWMVAGLLQRLRALVWKIRPESA